MQDKRRLNVSRKNPNIESKAMAARPQSHPSCTSKGTSFILSIKANDSILIKVVARRVAQRCRKLSLSACCLRSLLRLGECLAYLLYHFDPCHCCLTQFWLETLSVYTCDYCVTSFIETGKKKKKVGRGMWRKWNVSLRRMECNKFAFWRCGYEHLGMS